jgi:putative methyltransferase (TIGR04325 family)
METSSSQVEEFLETLQNSPMRHFVALFLPPVVPLIWRKINPVFLAALGRSNITDYTDVRLIKHVVNQSIAASKILKENRKINIDSFRVFFAIAMSPEKPSSVVDLGGAGGYHYLNAKTAYGEAALNWTIVETPEFCMHARQQSELNDVHFTSSLTEAFNRYDNDVDLFMCSRALQYLPNPLDALREACIALPKRIFLTGLAFSPDGESKRIKQYSSLTSNGPQTGNVSMKQTMVEYELQLLSRSAVEEIISQNFVILYETVEEARVHKLGSQHIPYTGIYAARKDIFSQTNPK